MLTATHRKHELRIGDKAQVDIVVPAIISSACGWDHVEIIQVGCVVCATWQGIESPGGLYGSTIDREGDFPRWQVIDIVQDQIAGVNVQAVAALDRIPGNKLAVLQYERDGDRRGY